MTSRRDFIVGGVLLGASVAAAARLPDQRRPVLAKGTLEQWIPRGVGPWRYTSSDGVVLPPADEMQDRLYDNLVTRTYEAADLAPVMLMLAYKSEQNGMLQIHRPEACYVGSGFTLSDTETVEVPVSPARAIPANRFLATAPDRIEQVLYWTREGDAFPTSWLGQKRDLLRANLRKEIPDGMLMRVSTLVEGGLGADLLERFVRDLVGAASPRLRGLLIGA